MCVAATGKVVRIDNEIAEVDFNGNIVRAHTGIIDVKPGDDVSVLREPIRHHLALRL